MNEIKMRLRELKTNIEDLEADLRQAMNGINHLNISLISVTLGLDELITLVQNKEQANEKK